ncbi:MAG: GNAT family N-acetyltransferase [Actinomycetota bacterium]
MDEPITFRPVEADDVPLLHRWRHEPHVARWWYEDDGSEPTLEVVARNYGPDPDEPERRFIIMLGTRPIGYIQTYLLADYPPYRDIVQEDGAGIDLFIGEPDLIDRGVGARAIERFLEDIVFADPSVAVCVVDPELENRAAIRAYAKAGFIPVRTLDVPGPRGPEILMRRGRNVEGRS